MQDPITVDPVTAASERSHQRSLQDYLNRDPHEVPLLLRTRGSEALGFSGLARERYVSRAFHDLEMERLWPRVWQVACHESEIATVGDNVVYEIGDRSIIVARVGETEIAAYHNSCLHRGTKLRVEGGSCREFRCPYHGWTWSLRGELTSLPCEWDFPHVDREAYDLPRVHVDTWLGFVFINMASDPPPLSSFLGGLPEHFSHWKDYAFGQVTYHVGRVLPANWKVGVEAFIESYHVSATHPQQIRYVADADTQYDTFPDEPHWNRMITPTCAPGPTVGYDVTEQELADEMAEQSRVVDSDGRPFQIPEGSTARAVISEHLRQTVGARTGIDMSGWSDSEMIDAIEYFIFPNFMPWFGARNHYAYRFRPHGDDPNFCLMETILFDFRKPNGATAGDSTEFHLPEFHLLGPDEPFTTLAGLGRYGYIFEQDVSNMVRVQQGLRAMARDEVTLGAYQESRIRHYHGTLDRYLDSAPLPR